LIPTSLLKKMCHEEDVKQRYTEQYFMTLLAVKSHSLSTASKSISNKRKLASKIVNNNQINPRIFKI
jgi:hypothetical protein